MAYQFQLIKIYFQRILNDNDMYGQNITLRNIGNEFTQVTIQLSNYQNYEIPIGA